MLCIPACPTALRRLTRTRESANAWRTTTAGKSSADLALEHGLKADESALIVQRLNREPNPVELGSLGKVERAPLYQPDGHAGAIIDLRHPR